MGYFGKYFGMGAFQNAFGVYGNVYSAVVATANFTVTTPQAALADKSIQLMTIGDVPTGDPIPGSTLIHGFFFRGTVPGNALYAVLSSPSSVTSENPSGFIDAVGLLPTTTGAAVGPGADPLTWTLTIDGLPLADADVWVSRDLAGLQVLDRRRSDTYGNVRFMLDKYQVDGLTLITYFGWAQKDDVVSIQAEPLTCD